MPDTLTIIGTNVFSGCKLTLLRIPPELHIYEFDFDSNTFRTEASSTTQNLGLNSVEAVIFSGSNYDLGDPAFYRVGNVSFQSFLPKNVNALLPEHTTGNIECSDKAKQQWVISEIPEWIRKKVTFVPATQVDDWVKSLVNATPKPTNIPEPTDTPQPTKTPQPSRAPQPTMTPQPTYAGFHVVNTPKPKATPQPTASPEPATESKKQSADPILFVFAGVLAAVIAGIVVLTLKSRQAKKKP